MSSRFQMRNATHSNAFRPGPPRGFTLLEVLVSMTILLAVLAVATRMFALQARAVEGQAGRLDALQNARYALTTIGRELRMAGAGTVDAQPILILATPTSIGFNANLVSADTTDQYAVYRNPDADPRATGVFAKSGRLLLPGTSDMYPDTTYEAGSGVPSAAETIVYWLEPDSSARNGEEHLLYRRVNDTPPEIVARGILVGPTDTVFRYFQFDGGMTPRAVTTPVMLHPEPEHGAPGDTAQRGALIDSVRAVRVRFRAAYDDRAGRQVVRESESYIRLMNAGLNRRSTCGDAPLGVLASATGAMDGSGVYGIRVTWGPSLDETAGERDVERYAIYRRDAATPDYGEPLASVPAGQSTYEFFDTQVRPLERWIYGVAALDCTPRSSPVGNTSMVEIP